MKKEENQDLVRLQKFLADNGIASRRKCEEYIVEGRVAVNGKIVTQLGRKINPREDSVEFNHKKVEVKSGKKVYILLNKPIGYVTTVKDQFERDTVLSLIKVEERIVPVGRLDMYTSGALLLSNDGDFVYQISHPKHEVEKVYVATVKGKVTEEEKSQLENGVTLEDGYQTKPAKVKILHCDTQKNITRLQITIHEGKNRQVRKMCEAIGKKVIALHRKQIGNLTVKDLPLGKWRYLKKEEVEHLLKK